MMNVTTTVVESDLIGGPTNQFSVFAHSFFCLEIAKQMSYILVAGIYVTEIMT
jgi:hypothetical protein